MVTRKNQMDILITSTFTPTGFVQASKAISGLIGQVAGLNKALLGMGKGGMGVMVTPIQNMGKVAKETSGKINNLNYGYAGYLANINRANRAAEIFNKTQKTTNISSIQSTDSLKGLNAQLLAGGRGFGGIITGAKGMVTNLRNIANTSASVGDVFGFYIGTVMLGAVKDLVFGFSTLKDEATSTFRYLGMPQHEIKAAFDGIAEAAARMPRVGIPELMDGWKKVRLSTRITGAEMVRFSGVFGDTITLFKANARTANDASLAIADAMAGGPGAFRRMYEISSAIKKERLMDLGWSGLNDDVTGFFTALEKVYGEMGITGISLKLESFGDIMDYVSDQAKVAGMKIGDGLLPVLKPLALALGQIIASPIGPWAVGAGIAFAGLFGTILVGVPLLQSLGASWTTVTSLMGGAVAPLTTRFRAFRFEQKALYGGMGAVSGEFAKMNKDMSKADLDFKRGIIRGDKKMDFARKPGMKGFLVTPDPIMGRGMHSAFRADAAGKMQRTAVYQMNKDMTKFNQVAGGSKKTLGGFTRSVNIFGKAGRANIGSFAKSGASAASSMLTLGFGLSNPIGKIILLAGVVITLLALFLDWGRIMDMAGDAIKRIGDFLAPTRKAVTDFIETAYEAIAAWGGWKFIVDVINEVGKAIFWLAGLAVDGIKWVVEVTGIDETLEAVGNIDKRMEVLWPKIRDGTATTKELSDALGSTGDAFWWLLNPINLVNLALATNEGQMKRNRDAFEKWTETPEGLDAMVKLQEAYTDLDLAIMGVWAAFEDIWNSMLRLRDMFDDVLRPLGELIDALLGIQDPAKDAGDTFGGTADKTSVFKNKVDILIGALDFCTWVINNLVIPAIKLLEMFLVGLGVVLFGIIWVIAMFIHGILAICREIDNFVHMRWGELWIVKEFQKIIDLIFGKSPGIIPGLKLIVATFGWMVGPIMGAIRTIANVGGGLFMRFINDVVVWFQRLPGRIGLALRGVGGNIWIAVQDGYNYVMRRVGMFVGIGRAIKDAVVRGIRQAFGMRSPSRVMSGLGEGIGEGLLQGMTQWIHGNIRGISNYMKKEVGGIAVLLANMFSNFKWVYYWDSRQPVSTTLRTMTANCWDAAMAFLHLARNMGLVARLYRVFLGRLPHMIIDLPTVGMWIDPSGLMGRGLRAGRAPGLPAGAPVHVYMQNPTVREEPDFDRLAMTTSRRLMDVMRYNI